MKNKGSKVPLCQNLAGHPLAPISNKTKRKKWELAYVESWRWRPPKPKPKQKRKRKKKISCLILNSCFQTLRSSSPKFSTLQALSSLIPNVQPAGDEVTIRGMWGGRWVGRRKGGRV